MGIQSENLEKISNKDTDNTLSANSDTKYPSQKAVKYYIDTLIGNANALVYKGTIDCSGNPNYPAADAGWDYVVSVAGKIGGASGVSVDVGDMLLCKVDSSASGDQATVGANWNIIEKNIVGAVSGPDSAVDNNIALFNNTTGKIIKDSGKNISTDGTFASNSDNKVPTEKAVKTYVGETLPGDGTQSFNNLLINSDFEFWGEGTTAVPTGWTLTGAVSSTKETTIIKTGLSSLKLTCTDSDGDVRQDITLLRGINYWKGRSISFSCWVKASVAGKIFLQLSDGVGSSAEFHSGSGNWEYITVYHTISSSAVWVQCRLVVSGNTNIGYFDTVMAVEGKSYPVHTPKFVEDSTGWNNFSNISTIVGFSEYTTKKIFYKVLGNLVFIHFDLEGTSNSTSITFTLPFNESSTILWCGLTSIAKDNGTYLTTPGRINIASTTTIYKDLDAGAWTNSGIKRVMGQFWYEKA